MANSVDNGLKIRFCAKSGIFQEIGRYACLDYARGREEMAFLVYAGKME
jgi:hypothetical protein